MRCKGCLYCDQFSVRSNRGLICALNEREDSSLYFHIELWVKQNWSRQFGITNGVIGRTSGICLLLLLCYVFNFSPVVKAESLSFQGYTGLLQIPSADTVEHGYGIAQYSDLMFYQNKNSHNSNLIALYGLLPGLEVSGRLAWFTTHSNFFAEGSEPRDLSANFKFRIPYIPENWLSLAVGAEDVGGQVSYFGSKYVVASRRLGPLKLHLGYANSNDRVQATDLRLDGGFGGIEYKPIRYLTLMAEHNGDMVNAGARASLPLNKVWHGAQLDITGLVYNEKDDDNSNDDQDYFFSLAVKFPLGGRLGRLSQEKEYVAYNDNSHPLKNTPVQQERAANAVKEGVRLEINPISTPSADPIYSHIINRLESVGFVNVSVGRDVQNRLWTKFENRVFNQNEIDAIGLIAGFLCTAGIPKHDSVVLVLMNQRMPVQQIEFNKQACQSLTEGGAGQRLVLPKAGHVRDLTFGEVEWLEKGKRSLTLKPRFTSTVSISNAVGTEFGVFDYSVGLYSNLSFNIAPGLLASISHLTPLDESDDFERGAYFSGSRLPSGSNEWNLQQTIPLGRYLWNTFHIGRFGKYYRGTFNHLNWFSKSGAHRITYRYGEFERDSNPLDKPEIRVVSYRYYMQKYDFTIETFHGKFWAGDEGYRIDTKFWFGDSAVGLYYRNTDAEFVGIRWTLPLGFRKDNNNLPILFTGVEAWNYELQTRINEDENRVSFSVGALPKWNWEPEREYFNNDRCGKSYYHRHVPRMRDAYQEYQHLLAPSEDR